MDATNVVFNGKFIKKLNDYQDLYELDGVKYAVEEHFAPSYGLQFFATQIAD